MKLKNIFMTCALALGTFAMLGTSRIANADHNRPGTRSRSDFRMALNNIYRADSLIVDGRYGRAEDEINSAIDHLRDDGGSEARRAIRYLNLCLDYMGDDDRRARDYLNEAESICEDNS